jgi:hypothetical protein
VIFWILFIYQAVAQNMCRIAQRPRRDRMLENPTYSCLS